VTVWRRYTVAWLGGVVIGMANGTARELTYRKRVGELTAHQISTATAIALFAAYFRGLERRWPIPSRRSALGIGATWLLLTVAFEFGFGHFVAKKSWAELLGDYDLLEGRVWSLVLAWLAFGPLAVRELRRRSGGAALRDGSERVAAGTRP
jgi:uncharacterized membrane protein (UPF0136 family)